MPNLSRSEIIILQVLDKCKSTNFIKALTIRKVSEKTDFSYYTVRNILKSLCLAGYSSKGCKSKNADTYFITEKGKQILEELKIKGGLYNEK